MKSVAAIKRAISQHPQNATFAQNGYEPLFTAHPKAKIVIIGQAPGTKAQSAARPWADKSGEQLRRWLGVSEEQFYDPALFALMPMDFYFPGKGKSGDLPPRSGFAELWHPKLFALMPHLELKILIGQYAQKYYLENNDLNLTETVKNFKAYQAAGYLPLPHSSPRNNIWKAKNPWFEKSVVPSLQKQIAMFV